MPCACIIALNSVHVNNKSTAFRIFGIPYRFGVLIMCKMYGIIEKLCADRGIKPGRLCSDIGISRGILGDLKNGRTKKLSAENVAKISAYFGVSADYLLGENEKAPTDEGERQDVLDEVDIAFYGDFKELSEADQDVIRNMVAVMRQRRAAEK